MITVGTIFAIGLGAAALLGIGGAAAGATAGEASEQAADTGVPKGDIFVYRELLKRGRSLVIANGIGAQEGLSSEGRKNLEPAA